MRIVAPGTPVAPPTGVRPAYGRPGFRSRAGPPRRTLTALAALGVSAVLAGCAARIPGTVGPATTRAGGCIVPGIQAAAGPNSSTSTA
jgi:hypothetical protein